MKSLRINAVVVKRRNFLEKDRILTLFSKEQGKVEALAKGARRPGNRLSPNSDIATIAQFHIHQTKSIDIISEIEPIYHPFGSRGDFDKTQRISYALKIIDKLYEVETPHVNSYLILEILIKTISDNDRQLIFLRFIIEVLHDLGALPNFVECAHCQKKIEEKDEFVFDLNTGLTHKECTTERCLIISKEEVKLLRLLASTDIEKMLKFKAPSDIFSGAYNVMLNYFNYEFGKILPDEVL